MAYATLLHPVKALSSVFPMVMYPRLTSLIFSFVSVTKSCLRYWHTQLPCTQGSKLCVPNGFAPKISIIAGIPSGCVHKIHITASVPSSCDIGLVYPVVVHTRSISLLVYPTTPNFLQPAQFLITQGSMHSMVVHSISVPFIAHSTGLYPRHCEVISF